jgi:hypothetical protein
MILVFQDKAKKEQIEEITKIYPKYTKIVVDIDKKVLAAGGEYHIDCEQILINNGSLQNNLWGGGYSFENKKVDFMGLTNYKPYFNHFSYEISLPEIREEVEKIIRKVFE